MWKSAQATLYKYLNSKICPKTRTQLHPSRTQILPLFKIIANGYYVSEFIFLFIFSVFVIIIIGIVEVSV